MSQTTAGASLLAADCATPGRAPSGAAGLAALLAVEAVVVFAGADRCFYFFDDVKWQMAAQGHALTLGWVTQPVNDHFVPGFLLLQRLVPPLGSYDYRWVAAVITAGVVALSAALWWLGRELLAPHAVRLAVAGLATACGVVAEETVWWSAWVHSVPSTLAVVCCLIASVRFWRTGSAAAAVAAAVALFVGDCFIEKVSLWLGLIPLYDLLVRQSAPSLRQRLAGVASSWRLHGSLAAASLAYYAWWWASDPFPARQHVGPVLLAKFTWVTWFEGFGSYLASFHGASFTPGHLTHVQLAGCIAVQVAAAAVALAALRRPCGRALAAWFALGFLASCYVLAAGRSGASVAGGAIAGRYQADTLVALAVCVLVASSVRSERRRPLDRWWHRPGVEGRPALVGVAVAVLTALVYWQNLSSYSDRTVQAAPQRLAFAALRALPAGTSVLDAPTPWESEAYGYSSPSDWRSMAGATEPLDLSDVGEGPKVTLDRSGHFRPVGALAGHSVAACSAAADSTPFPVGVPTAPPAQFRSRPSWVMWVDVSATQATRVTLQVAARGEDLLAGPLHDQWVAPTMGAPQVFDLPAGASQRLWFVANARWVGTVDQARLVVLGPGRACATAFAAGTVPAP